MENLNCLEKYEDVQGPAKNATPTVNLHRINSPVTLAIPSVTESIRTLLDCEINHEYSSSSSSLDQDIFHYLFDDISDNTSEIITDEYRNSQSSTDLSNDISVTNIPISSKIQSSLTTTENAIASSEAAMFGNKITPKEIIHQYTGKDYVCSDHGKSTDSINPISATDLNKFPELSNFDDVDDGGEDFKGFDETNLILQNNNFFALLNNTKAIYKKIRKYYIWRPATSVKQFYTSNDSQHLPLKKTKIHRKNKQKQKIRCESKEININFYPNIDKKVNHRNIIPKSTQNSCTTLLNQMKTRSKTLKSKEIKSDNYTKWSDEIPIHQTLTHPLLKTKSKVISVTKGRNKKKESSQTINKVKTVQIVQFPITDLTKNSTDLKPTLKETTPTLKKKRRTRYGKSFNNS